MVAPSFVICASPLSDTINLSMPLGPSVLARVSAIARHAEMFESSCGLPCEVSVPSLRRTMVGCLLVKGISDVALGSRSKAYHW